MTFMPSWLYNVNFSVDFTPEFGLKIFKAEDSIA